MNYSLDELYGSGIMGPTGNPAPTEYPYQDNLTDAYPITPDVVSTDTPVATTPTPTVPPPPSSEGKSSSEGYSVGTSGLNFDTLDKVEKLGTVDKRVAKRMAPIDAELESQNQQQGKILSKQAEIVGATTEIDKEKANLVAKHDLDQAALVTDYNNKIATEQERGQQRVNSAIATHQKMMQEYMTLEVDPGMMWKNMTGGEKLGSGLSVFASAFLGAKGIETPVMAMLDKALDRNIDAQLQNINQKGKALDQQGRLVQMVREQSASDLEAKLRLKEMATESAKYSIAAQMSQYGSKLAELKGQELITGLKQKGLEYRQGFIKERNQQEQIITGQEIQRHGDELQASAQSARLAFDKSEAALRRQREDDAAKGSLASQVNARAIIDPTDPNKFLIAPDYMDGKDVVKAQEKVNDTNQAFNITRELMEANRSLGATYQGPLKGLTVTERKAKRDQLRTMLRNNLAKQWNGTTFSDHWLKTLDDVIPTQSYTYDVNTDSTLGQFIEVLDSEAKSAKSAFREPNAAERSVYRPSVGAPIDSIGANRTDETPSSNTFGKATVDSGKASNINEEEPEKSRAKELGIALNKDDNNGAAKLSEPRQKEWDEYSKYIGNVKENGETFVAANKQFDILGDLRDRAITGDEEAFNVLVTTAKEVPSDKLIPQLNLRGYADTNLDTYDYFTDKAIMAQYFLNDLRARASGDTFANQYLNNLEAKPNKATKKVLNNTPDDGDYSF